jgi:FlaA1/EpsC-like NDP-sugar epimerase
MESFGVQTVYHAAAYKHVPLVEHNVVQGIRNNVFGTLYTARVAIAAKVETFVLISTDKTVRPTNVMGITKRMAELVLQVLSRKNIKPAFVWRALVMCLVHRVLWCPCLRLKLLIAA